MHYDDIDQYVDRFYREQEERTAKLQQALEVAKRNLIVAQHELQQAQQNNTLQKHKNLIAAQREYNEAMRQMRRLGNG